MTKKLLFTICVIIPIVLAACGSTPETTLSPNDIANTSVAEAWAMVTLTHAAQPTSTPAPPTVTPQATLTLFPTISIQPTLPAGVAASPTADQCNQVPPIVSLGTLVNVEFENESGGSVNLSFGMNSPNEKGECVTYTFTFSPFGESSQKAAKVLAGCYWGYGWVTGDIPSIAKTGAGILCMTDPNVIYHVLIGKEVINFK